VFLVLSKYDPDKIGSELAGMFVAPPGYKLVSFDLDSVAPRCGLARRVVEGEVFRGGLR